MKDEGEGRQLDREARGSVNWWRGVGEHLEKGNSGRRISKSDRRCVVTGNKGTGGGDWGSMTELTMLCYEAKFSEE